MYLECGCYISEVCDASSNDQHFPCRRPATGRTSGLRIYTPATFFSVTHTNVAERPECQVQEQLGHTGLTFGMPLSCHQRENGFSVVVGLLLTRRARVFTVVCQFIHSAQVADGVAAEGKTVKTRVQSVNGIDASDTNKHL